MTYRILSPALSELKEAIEYYQDIVPGLGADFIDEVESTIERIMRFPNAWGKISDDYRHCNLRRFPYAIIYTKESENNILIISVFHQSRKPSSWNRNIK